MRRDEDGPPIGALPTEAQPPSDTDPQPFRDDLEVTKRRCCNCGAEIGPDEHCEQRGEIRAYVAVYAHLVRHGVSPVTAARTIELIRRGD